MTPVSARTKLVATAVAPLDVPALDDALARLPALETAAEAEGTEVGPADED